jgi:hypothetical protein
VVAQVVGSLRVGVSWRAPGEAERSVAAPAGSTEQAGGRAGEQDAEGQQLHPLQRGARAATARWPQGETAHQREAQQSSGERPAAGAGELEPESEGQRRGGHAKRGEEAPLDPTSRTQAGAGISGRQPPTGGSRQRESEHGGVQGARRRRGDGDVAGQSEQVREGGCTRGGKGPLEGAVGLGEAVR